MSDQMKTISRYYVCGCCGGRRRITKGEIWRHIGHSAAHLRIVALDKDGVVVEQVERPQDFRWAMTYRDLVAGYRRSPGGAE